MHRRVPVFFLIDVSESMVGEPRNNVQNGLQLIINNLRNNPTALEVAYLSIIIFAGQPETLVSLTDLISFSIPTLPVGGGTALGAAMLHLMKEIDANVNKTSATAKGDWKPIVFLLTDGEPTDEVSTAVTLWNSKYKHKTNMVAISMGEVADTTVLKQFTDNVFIFKETNHQAYTEFFQLISASIESNSVVVTSGGEELQLLDFDNRLLEKVNGRKTVKQDERFAILLVRCRQSGKPYLMKFLKQGRKFVPEGAYIITEKYFNLTQKGHNLKVNTSLLTGIIPCPDCHAPGFAQCQCSHLFCYDRPGIHRCPWCTQTYTVDDGGHFDISRERG